MAFDLNDVVPTLQRKVSIPGSNLFPTMVDDDYLGYLEDAFWDARMSGFMAEWTLVDDTVEPQQVGGADITRDIVSVIILWAAINIVTNELKSGSTQFKAVAGPVSFEQQNSAQVLRDLLSELKDEKNIALKRLSDLGIVLDSYIDAVTERGYSMQFGNTFWTS